MQFENFGRKCLQVLLQPVLKSFSNTFEKETRKQVNNNSSSSRQQPVAATAALTACLMTQVTTATRSRSVSNANSFVYKLISEAPWKSLARPVWQVWNCQIK